MNHTKFNVKYDKLTTKWKWMALLSAIPKPWKEKLSKQSLLSNMIKVIDSKEVYIIINNTAKKR